MATVEKQPDTSIALMLDLETLALGMNAYVTQVGYCVANTVTREYLVKPRNLWMAKDHQASRTIDFDTVRWWAKQDPKVVANVFDGPEGMKRVSPQEVFHILEATVKEHQPVVYASPSSFDLSILTSLFGDRKPWKYNMERDMMTLYKLLDPLAKIQPPNNDMGHDAAADAHWQMEYLMNLLDRVRTLEDAEFRLAGLDK